MADAPDIFKKHYILTAGPTPLPPAVSQVMAEPILYHRAPAFVDIYGRALERLPRVFATENEVLCFAATGTGAMESAVANMVVAGEPAVVASCGKFGERWAELCDAYGADTTHIEFEWGTKVDPERLDQALAELGRPARAVYITQSETSTGVLNDVKALNEVVRGHDSVLCVDAVSGLGAVPLPQEEWGVDVVVAGSQKSLMCPPGLAFASVSDRAMALAAENPRGRYYLDWQRAAKGQKEEPPNSAFTPAVTLFRALDVALDLIFEEGLDAVYARHALLARAARAGVDALGLERFGPDDPNANVVTVARLPDDIAGAKVPKLMRDSYGVTIAGGQGHLKGQIARIAHCGYYGAFDILSTIAALEMTLDQLGADVTFGAGVAAAQKVFAGAGVVAAQVA